MQPLHQLFSRRNNTRRVDFRPDEPGNTESPASQLRRLRSYLSDDSIQPKQDLQGCDDAVEALIEYSYRKIFTGTSHAEYKDLQKNCPEHIDWQIAIHETESERFRNAKRVWKESFSNDLVTSYTQVIHTTE